MATVCFEQGEILRRQGHHYNDALLLLRGTVSVEIAGGDGARALSVGPGAPIGEIGFIHGLAATATVTALTPVEAVRVDDETVSRLEADRPQAAARILRLLAVTADERLSQNLTFQFKPFAAGDDADLEIRLCRSPQMLASAQRLRYDIYCGELGRKSPNADHERKTIGDDLDRFAHVFLAEDDGRAVATIRANLPCDGDIGVLGELYGMERSPHFPDHNAIVTKFIIHPDYRGGLLALRMIAAIVRLGEKLDTKECYIDCVPGLLPYYQALGFTTCGPPFLHRENGLSVPMHLDLVRHSKRLARDPTRWRMISLYLKARMLKKAAKLRARFRQPASLPKAMEASP